LADGQSDVMLWVYYSGHADPDGLHLGRSTLALDDLRGLVRGSAAPLRLLLVDSCKSGALTRVKGTRPAAPFEIRLENTHASEGVVFITSSAANEDSQESDELRGSIFTHFFASGLLGAADRSGDDKVSLAEAYAYAYEQTVRATSRLRGTQHPTFRLDVK